MHLRHQAFHPMNARLKLHARALRLSGFAFVGLFASALQAQTTPPPLEVKLAQPQRGEIHRYVALPGALQADRQAILYPKVAGYVKSIAVDKGDKVRAGQLLAEIEIPELAAERSRGRAEVEVAQAAFQRLSTAQAKAPDLIVPAAADEAKARVQIAKANLERTETLLGYGRIVAPFGGTITMRFADPGAFVAVPSAGGSTQNAALLTLMDSSTVRVQVMVPEAEAARVQTGQPVKVVVDGLAGKEFIGKVTRLAQALDPATRTMLVEADLPNADGTLLPGMYAKARIGVERHTNALLIPSEALVMEKTAAFVYIAADGKAKKLPITVGFNDGRQVEVLKGLEPTQSVILVGKLALTPDQPVKTAGTP